MGAVKKKRVSKNAKHAWRKHVDVTDVEDFLQEQYKPSISTLPNEELFTVDTKPAQVEYVSKSKKKLRALEPPKCFAILRPHTNVPDPITKRNRVRSKEERKNDVLKKKEELMKAKGILKHRQQQSIRDKKLCQLRRENAPKRGEFNHNIWQEEEEGDLEKNEWIPKKTKVHNTQGVGIIKKAKLSKKFVSVLPKIEPPHPGTSYNPSFGDHQDLLKQIVEKEKKIIKEEEHLNRVTTHMFSKVTEETRDKSWMEEMLQGLPQFEVKDEKTESDDEEYAAINPPVENQKKTLKQRRKQKEQLELKLRLKKSKIEKKKITDLHQMKLVKRQIEKTESKQSAMREKREKVKKLKEKEPKQLSSIKYEEPDVDFNMVKDLQGNLRNLKSEGNLLRDRFASLQKRNIIEVAVHHNRKKAKTKVYTRPGHKTDWKKTVARSMRKV